MRTDADCEKLEQERDALKARVKELEKDVAHAQEVNLADLRRHAQEAARLRAVVAGMREALDAMTALSEDLLSYHHQDPRPGGIAWCCNLDVLKVSLDEKRDEAYQKRRAALALADAPAGEPTEVPIPREKTREGYLIARARGFDLRGRERKSLGYTFDQETLVRILDSSPVLTSLFLMEAIDHLQEMAGFLDSNSPASSEGSGPVVDAGLIVSVIGDLEAHHQSYGHGEGSGPCGICLAVGRLKGECASAPSEMIDEDVTENGGHFHRAPCFDPECKPEPGIGVNAVGPPMTLREIAEAEEWPPNPPSGGSFPGLLSAIEGFLVDCAAGHVARERAGELVRLLVESKGEEKSQTQGYLDLIARDRESFAKLAEAEAEIPGGLRAGLYPGWSVDALLAQGWASPEVIEKVRDYALAITKSPDRGTAVLDLTRGILAMLGEAK